MKDNTKSAQVFTGEIWQAEMVKNLLENQGINSFLINDIMGTILPVGAGSNIGAVKVVVAQEHEEEALKIVDEYLSNLKK